MQVSDDWIVPDWPVATSVRAVTTTRQGGVSRGSYASMNPAAHVDDDPAAVLANRQTLQQVLDLPGQPVWLQQVHGTEVVNAATAGIAPTALADTAGQCVAVIHAGWRGLAAGVIEQAATAMGRPGETLLAWLGPAIGPSVYRVGDDVRDTFMNYDPEAAGAFRQGPDGEWFADLYQLARQRLADCRVTAVYGGGYCSFTDSERFYSYRRDGATGRMVTLIWLEE
jgi:copper oxidase (laccase) domain-containing protein